ncbi:MAG: putative anti-sigma regulatory factor, serine/threonine protein kinase [Thermoleophilia bacterium]|nr:putative anti-sigma regulatory factor, serine/threonine protein kinase [Thermoleophilia bacterium]
MSDAGPRVRVELTSDHEIVHARKAGREIAQQLGFSTTDQVLIATAISELARNIVLHAGGGAIEISTVSSRPGIAIVATDTGPGIRDVELALQDGYSTGIGLGLGLPGARRISDEFMIETRVGHGTSIFFRKYVP